MRRLLLLFGCLFVAAAFAQQKPLPKLEPLPEPPPPPPMPGIEEPRVNIPIPKEDQVEELREGGRVVMLKVTPPGGAPYYLVDPDGNGNWVRRDGLNSGLRVPQWPVKTWP